MINLVSCKDLVRNKDDDLKHYEIPFGSSMPGFPYKEEELAMWLKKELVGRDKHMS